MNIFLADASADVRIALQMLLDNEPGMRVTGLAGRTEGLLTQVEASNPDVLLLGLDLPGGSMPDLLAGLQTMAPRPIVILLTMEVSEEEFASAAGVDAVFSKTLPSDELVTFLRRSRAEIGSGRFT